MGTTGGDDDSLQPEAHPGLLTWRGAAAEWPFQIYRSGSSDNLEFASPEVPLPR